MTVPPPVKRRPSQAGNNGWLKALAAFLLVISVAVIVEAVRTATQRQLSSLEGVLFSAFSLAAGYAGSFIFGRFSAAESAREVVRAQARGAFRRLVSHYGSLSRLVSAIDRARDEAGDPKGSPSRYDALRAVTVEIIAIAGDALEDWRDVVPEEVEEIERRAREQRAQEEKQDG
jgi:hypothetical protein